jgi:hypothetical protein
LIERHGLTQAEFGVFALVGAAGAASAPVAGYLGDRGTAAAGLLWRSGRETAPVVS